jgi:hypothetical protein
MPQLPIETPLEFLAKATFPDYRALAGESSPGFSPSDARRAEFEQWWARHQAMAPDELRVLVDAARERAAARRAKLEELKEQKRFFNEPRALANVDYWSKAAHWTLDEWVALSLGRAPEVVNLENVERYASKHLDGGQWSEPSPFAVEYKQRHELARRAIVWKKLFNPAPPLLFVAWAKSLDIAIPAQLISAVELRAPAMADWQTLFNQQKAMTETWKQTAASHASVAETWKLKAQQVLLQMDEMSRQSNGALAAAKAEIAELRSRADKGAAEELHPRVRDTLLKLLIGMAIEGYRFDPKAPRSEAPAEITNDVSKLGMSMTDDTVRRYLKEAAETVLPKNG